MLEQIDNLQDRPRTPVTGSSFASARTFTSNIGTAGNVPGLGSSSRPFEYTLCTTLRCNLACPYCYVSKTGVTMELDMARKAIDFIFRHAPAGSYIDIGFFGGEPLLEFELLQQIVELIKNHPAHNAERTVFTITTNGTFFSESIASFLKQNHFRVCVSCDGPPHVQNTFRRTAMGQDSAAVVESTVLAFQQALASVTVNAVHHPLTFRYLPETVEYLSGLGVRQIHLNPDFSAPWTSAEADELPGIYGAIAERWEAWYLEGDSHFISLIDSKIAVLLRGGYQPLERCQMGHGEMAFTPDGGIYPCARLISSRTDAAHRIGDLIHGIDLSKLLGRCASGARINPECESCGLKDCCVHWCGCSNIFMTGFYNRVGPFLCASERALFQVALNTFRRLEKRLGPAFLHHLTCTPQFTNRPQ